MAAHYIQDSCTPLDHLMNSHYQTPHKQHVLRVNRQENLAMLKVTSYVGNLLAPCLAGWRLMSWLLGTHILHACVLPKPLFPSSVIGFSHLAQSQSVLEEYAAVASCFDFWGQSSFAFYRWHLKGRGLKTQEPKKEKVWGLWLRFF